MYTFVCARWEEEEGEDAEGDLLIMDTGEEQGEGNHAEDTIQDMCI